MFLIMTQTNFTGLLILRNNFLLESKVHYLEKGLVFFARVSKKTSKKTQNTHLWEGCKPKQQTKRGKSPVSGANETTNKKAMMS